MNEYSEFWIVAYQTGGGLVKYTYKGKTEFHAMDARTALKEAGAPYEMLHFQGLWPAEHWTGDPDHADWGSRLPPHPEWVPERLAAWKHDPALRHPHKAAEWEKFK